MDIQKYFYSFPEWTKREIVETSELDVLLFWGVILAVFFALLLFAASSLVSRRTEFRGNWLLKLSFIIVWTLGFTVYDVGMFTGNPWSLLGNAPMAFLHAFGIFILENDVSEIQEPFHHNAFFMFVFSFVHFAAAFISMWFVIKHFGFNIIAGIKRFFAKSWFCKKRNTTYIFWGMNNATYHLAKSINVHHQKNGGAYRIVIVRTRRDTDTSNFRNGLERMFNFLSMNRKDIDKLRDIEECITANNYSSLPDYDASSQSAVHDIFGAMGLKSVAALIKKKTTEHVHVFFLSDENAANIKAAANLRVDDTLAAALERGLKVTFYCHARRNSISRVIEDLDVSNNVEVRIVDTSHLSIECLKREVSLQPVSFVDIDKEKNYGTVTSPFTSLVVGFGETGKDALRFLYEFGAFVDSDTTNGTHRSLFNCHVVDKQLDAMEGPFRNAAPQMFANKNVKDGSPLVAMHAVDYNSDEFYNHLFTSLAPTLNYVVIAVGSDEAGMTLAVRILKCLRREGRDFKKLRILVRSYDSSLYPHMQKIAEHYNEEEERIVLFGDEEQLFTYSMVIEDEFEQRGRDYYEFYRALNPQHDEDGSWEQRRKKLMGQNPRRATLNSLQKLRRKETQDKANALHEATKMRILETVLPNWRNQLAPSISNRLLMDNLAKLEHLRWNASHEVLGYTPMPDDVPDQDRGCDEARMQHNCLVDWDELDAESARIAYVDDYKVFDYGVVETTIDIYRRKKTEKENEK